MMACRNLPDALSQKERVVLPKNRGSDLATAEGFGKGPKCPCFIDDSLFGRWSCWVLSDEQRSSWHGNFLYVSCLTWRTNVGVKHWPVAILFTLSNAHPNHAKMIQLDLLLVFDWVGWSYLKLPHFLSLSLCPTDASQADVVTIEKEVEAMKLYMPPWVVLFSKAVCFCGCSGRDWFGDDLLHWTQPTQTKVAMETDTWDCEESFFLFFMA